MVKNEPNKLEIFSEKEYIKSNINERKIDFFLVTKFELQNLKTKSDFLDFLAILFSITMTIFLTLMLNPLIREKNQSFEILMWLSLLISIGAFVFWLIYKLSNNRYLKKLTSRSKKKIDQE